VVGRNSKFTFAANPQKVAFCDGSAWFIEYDGDRAGRQG